jgi:hypothetical protein
VITGNYDAEPPTAVDDASVAQLTVLLDAMG